MKRDPIPATAILYLYSLGLLLFLMLQACGPAGNPILEQAAGLVESSPDSALRRLSALDSGRPSIKQNCSNRNLNTKSNCGNSKQIYWRNGSSCSKKSKAYAGLAG